MKKSFLLVVLSTLLFSSCKKYPHKWDSTLNGTWVEVDPATNAIINSSYPCALTIADNYLDDCGTTYPALSFSSNEKLYAHDGQIYETYKILIRNHLQFDFDYAFDGQYLWLIEDFTSAKAPVINQSSARKYKKQ